MAAQTQLRTWPRKRNNYKCGRAIGYGHTHETSNGEPAHKSAPKSARQNTLAPLPTEQMQSNKCGGPG
eukprot:11160897-Lingulodinium_polyedra.AAC.1